MSADLLSIASFPTGYHVAFYRILAKRLGERFMALFVHGGHAVGMHESSWGGSVIKNTTGLLEGYPHRVFDVRPDLSPEQALQLMPAGFEETIAELRPKAILVNDDGRSLACRSAIRVAHRLGARLLLRSTPYDLRRSSLVHEMLRTTYLRRKYQPFAAFCAVGTLPRLHFVRYSGRPDAVFSSPYCTDEFFLERFSRAETRNELRRAFRSEHGLAADERIFLTVSRLVPAKRIGWTIAAFRHSLRNRSARLIVVGDGPQRHIVEQELRGGDGKRMLWLGAQDRLGVVRALAASDAFLLASDYEPWGVVINEALAFRLPIVASDRVAAAYDLVASGVTGLTFRAGELDAYQRALAQMHAFLDRPLNREAFDTINQTFSAESAADGILAAAQMANVEPDHG